MRARLGRSLLISFTIVLSTVPATLADPTLEVEVEGSFIPLDRALVGTPRARIRVSLPPGESLVAAALARDDGRAGPGGAGKPIPICQVAQTLDCLEETTPGELEGVIETLVGLNRVQVETDAAPGAPFTATMLVFASGLEDVNGNGILDVEEDTDGDGVLDPGEDTNGNGLLDSDEDVNGNARLDVSEDLDGDGQISDAEDLDGDGEIDALAGSVGPSYASDESDYSSLDGTAIQYSARAIQLDLVDGATMVDASALLRAQQLDPLGITIDNTLPARATLLTVGVPGGTDALDLVRLLNGLGGQDSFFPPSSALPIGPTLEVAIASFRITPPNPPQALAESLPERLREGADALPSTGNVGDAYDEDLAGFDDNGSGADAPYDELDLAWGHFIMQSYPALRLVDHATKGVGALSRPVMAIVDGGLGDGSGAALDDLRITRQTVCDAENCRLRPLQELVDPDGHGTAVMHLAAGLGARVLGLGKHGVVRPIKSSTRPQDYTNGLLSAALDPAVSVIVVEIAYAELDRDGNGTIDDAPAAADSELARARGVLNTARRTFLPAIRLLQRVDRGKIVIFPAGNDGHDTDFTLLGGPRDTARGTLDGLFDVPRRAERDPGRPGSLMVGVANSTVLAPPGGREMMASSSNFGSRISVAAPSQGIPSVAPNLISFQPFGGTSGAAPQVAGLVTLLEFLDRNSDVGPFEPIQVVELVEATADDLGTRQTQIGPIVLKDNDDPGDGPDDIFGHGRINAWKAVLSALNGGIAVQPGRAPAGNDSTFDSLTVVDDGATEWYGFEIITSEPQASVWLDGVALTDPDTVGEDATPGTADDLIPFAPAITAYKGVRTRDAFSRGVHTATDGTFADAGSRISEDEPRVGIVPRGTREPGTGPYLMHFSIPRDDLYDDQGQPKTLSLRRRQAGAGEKPLFNLRLDTARMRTGEVAGVAFDDFVFQVAPPDFGDAPFATTLTENGARHENSSLEWLGLISEPHRRSVSPEHNAAFEATGGDPRVDVDGIVNRTDERANQDGRDDGLRFFPLTYVPGQNGRVEFTVHVHDKASGRYIPVPDALLYFNLWIDWNGNGIWEEINDEHVIDGLELEPGSSGAWRICSQGESGSNTQLSGLGSLSNSALFESQIPVGSIGSGPIWARARLDYGENAGRNDPRPSFTSLPSLRDPALAADAVQPAGGPRGGVLGAARYGEVEDYLIGSDFGDAADTACSEEAALAPNTYPTCGISDGAYHLDFHKEWLGPDPGNRASATREVDADDRRPPGTDEDAAPNLFDEQDDLRDDGVIIPPLIPGETVTFRMIATASIAALGGTGAAPGSGAPSVSVPEEENDSLPRYGGSADRVLYLAGWADWNGDGVWAPNEKIIDDVQDPTGWGKDDAYNLGEDFEDDNGNGVHDANEDFTDVFGRTTRVLEYEVDVPLGIAPRFSLRFRLGYGEDENETKDILIAEAIAEPRVHAEELGGALFGEVEDYLYTRIVEPDDGITIDLDLGLPGGPGGRIRLGGPAGFGIDPDRVGDPDGDGKEEVDAEIVSAQLVGFIPGVGQVLATVRDVLKAPYQRSVGVLEESSNAVPGTVEIPPCGTGTFQLYLDIFLVDQAITLHNDDPIELTGFTCDLPIGSSDFYAGTGSVTLHDDTGAEMGSVGNAVVSLAEEESWFFDNVVAHYDIRIPDDSPVQNPVLVRGSAVLSYDPNALGDADADGLEDAPVELEFFVAGGNTPTLGNVTFTLRSGDAHPFQPSVGTVEEGTNLMSGRLDVAPDVPGVGPALLELDTFFSIEIDAIGETVHNEEAHPAAGQISQVPPAAGDRLDVLQLIKLLTAALTRVARLGIGTVIPAAVALELEPGFTARPLLPGYGGQRIACTPLTGNWYDDEVVVTDSSSGQLRGVDSHGNSRIVTSGLNFPLGVQFFEFDGADRAHVSEFLEDTVSVIDFDGTQLGDFTIDDPGDIVRDPDDPGTALVSTGFGGTIRGLDIGNATITTFSDQVAADQLTTLELDDVGFSPGVYASHVSGDSTFDFNIPASLTLPDAPAAGTPGVATLPFTVPVDLTLSDCDFTITVFHPELSDLTIDLEHDGNTVRLWDRDCPGAADLVNRFDDEGTAQNCNPSGSTPDPADGNGRMAPRGGALSDFDGMSSLGGWVLTITDHEPGNAGSLSGFTLHFVENDSGVVSLDAAGSVTSVARGADPGGLTFGRSPSFGHDLFAVFGRQIDRIASDGSRSRWGDYTALNADVTDVEFCRGALFVGGERGAWKVVADADDVDGDGQPDGFDDCVDTDGDGVGDRGFPGDTCGEDNCGSVYNPDQTESDGRGDFGPAVEVEVLDFVPVGLSGLFTCDLSGDGNEQLIRVVDSILEFDFDPARGTFVPGDAISLIATGANELHCGRVDSDGNADVVSAGTTLEWFRQAADGSFEAAQTISTVDYPWVRVANVDGDGDLDVVTHTASSLDWYENDGNGNGWTFHTFFDGSDVALGAELGDVDGDGDLDAVTVGNQARVWINDGSGEFTVTQSVPLGGQADNVWLAYFDGDGGLDALVGGAQPAVLRNDGDGSFGPATTLPTLDTLSDAAPTDVDGDGDLDVVATFPTADTVAWSENVGGDATFAQWSVIDPTSLGAFAVASLDADGDGDAEVVVLGSGGVDFYEGGTDGLGDACDPCTDPDGDTLGDAAPGVMPTCSPDNCPFGFNPGQGPVALDADLLVGGDKVTFKLRGRDGRDLLVGGYEMISGDLSQLASEWAVDRSATISGSDSFVDDNVPQPGEGDWFLAAFADDCLVRSWQTEVGSEPGRDVALP